MNITPVGIMNNSSLVPNSPKMQQMNNSRNVVNKNDLTFGSAMPDTNKLSLSAMLIAALVNINAFLNKASARTASVTEKIATSITKAASPNDTIKPIVLAKSDFGNRFVFFDSSNKVQLKLTIGQKRAIGREACKTLESIPDGIINIEYSEYPAILDGNLLNLHKLTFGLPAGNDQFFEFRILREKEKEFTPEDIKDVLNSIKECFDQLYDPKSRRFKGNTNSQGNFPDQARKFFDYTNRKILNEGL